MNETVITVIVVVVLIIVMSLFSLKKKNESWEGVLVKKKSSEDPETNQVTYKLTFKTDDGKKKRVQVNKSSYESFFVDARYKKEKGGYIPKPV